MFMKTKCLKEQSLVKIDSLVNYAGRQFYQIPKQILPEPLTFRSGSLLMLVESTSIPQERKCYLNLKNELETNFNNIFEKENKTPLTPWGTYETSSTHSATSGNSCPFQRKTILWPNSTNNKTLHLSITIPKSP